MFKTISSLVLHTALLIVMIVAMFVFANRQEVVQFVIATLSGTCWIYLIVKYDIPDLIKEYRK